MSNRIFKSIILLEMEQSNGEIFQESSSFEWKIKDFLSVSAKTGDVYESPPFGCFEAVWKIQLYANGCNAACAGFISRFLRKVGPESSTHIVRFNINIKCHGKIMKYDNDELFRNFSANTFWGCKNFIERSVVLEEMNITRQKDLTLSIIMTCKSIGDAEQQDSNSHESVSIPPKPKAMLENLVHSLKELYINQSNCDFTLHVKDQSIQAHKLILGARSSVFAAMFAHDMAENLSGNMTIEDFEPDIVKDFLMYMYTGDVESLSWENVTELYAISDKYNAEDLKNECLKFMKSKLCPEKVCTVLLLAEKYHEEELFERAKREVTKCAAKLLSSDHWETLANENTFLAHKVLKLIVVDNAWRII